MKKIVRALFAVVLCAAQAGEWKNLTDDNWLGGRRTAPGRLKRKVVLTMDWSWKDPACLEQFAQLQKFYTAYAGKPFMLVASQRADGEPEKIKSLVAEQKVSFPVYFGAELSDAPGSKNFPYFYVVNHAGKVTYAGGDVHEAMTAAVDAITELPVPGELIGGVTLKKYKSLRNQLVLGKSVESGNAIAQVKNGAQSKNKSQSIEAQSILNAIESTHKLLAEQIKDELAEQPAAAYRDLDLYLRTWPSERAEYGAKFDALKEIPDIQKIAKFGEEVRRLRILKSRVEASAKLRKAEFLRAGSDSLVEGADPRLKAEAKQYLAELDDTIAELKALVNRKKKDGV